MKFSIETGGWQNIARNDRICTFCRDNIGDEFHYLFIKSATVSTYDTGRRQTKQKTK
jgi:hypothetical protein